MPATTNDLPSRRQLLALAAALAATTLTAFVAVAGLSRRPSAPVPLIQTVSGIVTPATPAPVREPQEPGG